MRLWKKIPNCWRCDFFDSAQTVTASRQKALHYDWSASGSIIYTYVDDDPLRYSDSLGLMGHASGAIQPHPPLPKVKVRPLNPCKIDLRKLIDNAKKGTVDPATGKQRTDSTHECANTVRMDIVNAHGNRLPGLSDEHGNYPTEDKWGHPLITSGCYKLVTNPDYKPQPGDIAITVGTSTGHISIFDGDTWDADYPTKTPEPGSTGRYEDSTATLYQYIGINNMK